MKEYKFEIYYKYDGPSHSDPFPEEKNSEQIQDALGNFVNEVQHYIESLETTVFSFPVDGDIERRIVSIKTITKKEEVNEAVKRCLQDLDLRANIL